MTHGRHEQGDRYIGLSGHENIVVHVYTHPETGAQTAIDLLDLSTQEFWQIATDELDEMGLTPKHANVTYPASEV